MAKKRNNRQTANRSVRVNRRSMKELKPVIAVSLASFGLHMALAEIMLEGSMQSGILIACLTPLLVWGCVSERGRNLLTLGGAIAAICIGAVLPGGYLVSRNLWWGVGAFVEAAVLFVVLILTVRKLKN